MCVRVCACGHVFFVELCACVCESEHETKGGGADKSLDIKPEETSPRDESRLDSARM